MSAVDDLRDRLIAARLAAATADEVIAAVARVEYFNRQWHAGNRTVGALSCPLELIPSGDDLAGWTWHPGAAGAFRNEADARLTKLYGGRARWERVIDDTGPVPAFILAAYGPQPAGAPGMVAERIEHVHARWRADPCRHPLAPLVEAWQTAQRIPAAPRVLVNRGSLPRLALLGENEARLPDFPAPDAPAPDGQLLLDLPDLSPAVRGCASWMLWLFDRAGGDRKPRGRGARWDLRLFVYALLHLDVADRDGQWHTIRLAASPDHAKAIADATGRLLPNVEDWLHPNGWENRSRDWHKLPEALDRMRRLAYMPIPGIGRVAVLFPSVIPATADDPLVEFTLRVPPVAARGDPLNWPRLTQYGAEADRLFRAYLAVVAWLGRSARGGHPITRTIAAPVLGPDGKPRRRKGGRVIRSATERTDNPATRYVAPLSEADLPRMTGFDLADRNSPGRALKAFERFEEDGVIEIDRSGGGFLVYAGPNW